MTPLERIALPVRRHSIAIRAARLIDALIDGAHRGWPDVCFMMRLPSGEQIFVPAHRSAGPPARLVMPGISTTVYGPSARWIRPFTGESVA
jgi:hypothetical protein